MTEASFWKDKNVFVTGASGFVGSWLTKSLVDKEANVVILIRDLVKDPGFILFDLKNKINIIQGDLIDYDLIYRILNEYKIDTCFHLAAQAIVGVANQNPISTFESNIKGTWNLLEGCRNSSFIKRVVVTSSDKAYGVQKKLPYYEDSPLLGLYPYDASKVCTDVLARCYYNTYNLPVAVIRGANIYGGGDLNLSRIIPDTILSILQGKELLIRSDGRSERDYIYIKDVVDAYLLLAENLHRDEVKGEAFNFGTSKPTNVLDLFNKIIDLCGKKGVKPKILGEARNEIDRQYLSANKAKKILKWTSKYDLDRGLRETIDWYKNYLESKS